MAGARGVIDGVLERSVAVTQENADIMGVSVSDRQIQLAIAVEVSFVHGARKSSYAVVHGAQIVDGSRIPSDRSGVVLQCPGIRQARDKVRRDIQQKIAATVCIRCIDQEAGYRNTVDEIDSTE